MSAQFDVCIIGGGIQGVGVAQAAAAAGYKVVLLEKDALASATSSRSSKLIHGGLRYLESAQFSLVSESLYERELLIKNAPDLVRRVPFYIPVYKNTTRSSFKIFAGLSLYALLGKLKAPACFRRLEQKDWEHLDGLNQRELKTVFEYHDAQTDDVKLTQAVMYSACELGAELLCPANFNQANLISEKDGYEVHYEYAGKQQSLKTRTLVNASGPWVDSVQSHITPTLEHPEVELVQGAHIIVKQPAPRGVYYVESPSDQRAVFIMPWYEHTMVGTTETLFNGDPMEIKPTEHEKDYLQNIMHYYFPDGDDEITDSFAGVRVLPKANKSMFNRSRDTIYISDEKLPGYVALMGGKLTGYRAAAQAAIRHINDHLPEKSTMNDTREIQLQKVDYPFV